VGSGRGQRAREARGVVGSGMAAEIETGAGEEDENLRVNRQPPAGQRELREDGRAAKRRRCLETALVAVAYVNGERRWEGRRERD
jgi:hypothetical protein